MTELTRASGRNLGFRANWERMRKRPQSVGRLFDAELKSVDQKMHVKRRPQQVPDHWDLGGRHFLKIKLRHANGIKNETLIILMLGPRIKPIRASLKEKCIPYTSRDASTMSAGHTERLSSSRIRRGAIMVRRLRSASWLRGLSKFRGVYWTAACLHMRTEGRQAVLHHAHSFEWATRDGLGHDFGYLEGWCRALASEQRPAKSELGYQEIPRQGSIGWLHLREWLMAHVGCQVA